MEYVTQLSKSVFIDYGKLLGEGSYATVFKGYRGSPGNTIAIKKLKQNAARMWHNDPNKRLKREVEVLTSISHPNVMKLEEVIEQKNGDVFLVMQFCSGETLECRTNKKIKGTDHQPSKLLPEIKIYDIFQQLVRAMTYVHEQGFMHRDLKPENLMLMEDGTIKILDFGVARSIENENMVVSYTGRTGSPLYMPPNFVLGDGYTNKCDVWSAGLLLYEILTGQHYFKEAEFNSWEKLKELHNKLKQSYIVVPQRFSKYFRSVLQRMVAYYEEDRPSFRELQTELDKKWLEYGRSIDPNYRSDVQLPLKLGKIVPLRQADNPELGSSDPKSPNPPPLRMPVQQQPLQRYQRTRTKVLQYVNYMTERADIFSNLVAKLITASQDQATRFTDNLQLATTCYLLICHKIQLMHRLKFDLEQPVLIISGGDRIELNNLMQYQEEFNNLLQQKVKFAISEINCRKYYILNDLYKWVNPNNVQQKNPGLYKRNIGVYDSVRELKENNCFQNWAFYSQSYTTFLRNEFRPTSTQLSSSDERPKRLFYECVLCCSLHNWLPDYKYKQPQTVARALQEINMCPIQDVMVYVEYAL